MGFNFGYNSWGQDDSQDQPAQQVPDNLYQPGSGAVTNSGGAFNFGYNDWNNVPDNTYYTPQYRQETPYYEQPQYQQQHYNEPQYNAPSNDPYWSQFSQGQEQNQPQYNIPDNLYVPGTDAFAGAEATGTAGNPQTVAYNDRTGKQLVVPNSDPNDFFGNLYRAAVLPSEVNAVNNDRPNKMPWDVGLEALGNIAEGTFGALGQAISPLGKGVDLAADSNIPVVSQAGQLVRGAAENVVEPIFNFTPSVVGDVTHGQFPSVIKDAISNLNPFDDYDKQSITQAKLGYVQDAYNSAIAAGRSDEDASKIAEGLDRKLSSFAQLSEYQGLQRFGTLPALAQLGIMLADPVANLGAEAFLAGRLPRGLTEGKIAESTLGGRLGERAVEGVDNLTVPRTVGDVANSAQNLMNYANPINYLSKPNATGELGPLATGQGRLANYDVQTEPITDILQQHADANNLTGQEAIRQFLYDPTSPVYRDTLGAPKYITDRVEQVYNALPPEKVGSDSVLQPGEEFQAPGKAEFGYNAQDTNATVPFDETGGKNLPNKYTPAEQGTVTPEVQAANAQGANDFAQTFNSEVQPKAPLAEKYTGVQLPQKDAGIADYFGSAKQIYGVDKGVLKLDGTIKKPTLLATRPLEEVPGVIGKPLQALSDTTNTVFAPVFLNTFSRAVRDSLSNYAKMAVVDPAGLVRYVAKKIGIDDGTTSRYELVSGRRETPQLGPASAAADVADAKGVKGNPLATAWYILANPQNEIPARIISKLTNGKFKDYTTFVERNEEKLKSFMYKREFLRHYDNAVNESVRAGKFRQLQSQFNLTDAQIGDFLKGKMPAGADIADYAGKVYNPANLSDTLRSDPRMSKVLDGNAGPVGDVVASAMNSFKAEVDAENATRLAEKTKQIKLADRIKDPVVKQKRLTEIDRNFAPLDNVVPGSELWNKIDTSFNKELDNLFTTQAVASVTPEVLQAYNQFTKEALAYVKRSKDLSAFRQSIESEVASREATYAQKYGNKVRPGTPAKITKTPTAPLNEVQQKVLDWATKRYQLTSNRGVSDAAQLDSIAKSNKGRGIQLSQIKKWLDGGELGKSNQNKALMYEEGHEPPVYWMDRNSKAYNAANEVPRGKQEVTPATPQAQTSPTINKAEMQGYYDRVFKRNVAGPDGFYSANAARDRVNRGDYAGSREGLLKVDEQIRAVTGNRFQLDLDTLTPIGRPGTDVDGYYLTDLAGRGKPYDTVKPIFPPKLPAEIADMDVRDTIKAIEQHYGDKAYKPFSEMEPAERDAVMNEIAEAVFNVKPQDPLAPMNKAIAERDEVARLWQDIKADITDRYNQDFKGRTAYQSQVIANQERQAAIANALNAERNRLTVDSHRAGYSSVKNAYFDYRNKNKVDQLLGSVLPFQYWARQNFAFVAKHFATHPAHFAAILNFYKQVEKENSDPNIPDYAKGDIFGWQNPDGSKVMFPVEAFLPINPFGSSDSIMQLISPGDSTGRTVRNTDPLAILIGSDIKSATTGKVTGRDKGILPSFIRPNPLLELAFKTGNINNLLTSLGIAQGDQSLLGQDYTEDTRAQKETSGFIPANSFYQEIGAATGLTKTLRDAGVVKGDLSPESLINEGLFGKNAGKPQTKIIQELTAMAQRKEISPEQAKLAIAGYKEGNWTPEALKALDLVDSENAGRRLLTNIGFTTVVLNTPRQQLTNQLYAGLDKAYDGDKSKTILGPDGKKIYVPSDASKFYSGNPGASVLTSANDSPEQIRQSLADDKTRQSYSDLVQQSVDKKISARDFNLAVAKLQAANPQYFVDHPLKQGPKEQLYNEQLQDYQNIGGSRYDELSKRAFDLSQSGDKAGAAEIYNSADYRNAKISRDQFMSDHPEFKSSYVAYLKSKGQDYKEPDPAQQEYYDKLDEYNKIGGDAYDKLSAALSKAYDNNDKKAQAAIFSNPVYQRGKASRDQFILDNPAFAQQYKEYLQGKGYTSKDIDPNAPLTGTSKYPTTSKSSSYTSSGKPYSTSSSSKKSTYVPYAQYKAQQQQASSSTRLPSSNSTTTAPTSRAEVASLTAKKPAGTVGRVASVPAATADDLTTRGWDGKYFPEDFGRTASNVWKYSGEAVQDAQKLMANDDSIVAVAVYSSDLKGYFVYTKPKTELTTSDISLINSQNRRIGLPDTNLTAKPKVSSSSIKTGGTIAKSNTSGYSSSGSNKATTSRSLPFNLDEVFAAGKTKSTSSTARRSSGGGRRRSTRLPGPSVSFSPGVSVRRPKVYS